MRFMIIRKSDMATEAGAQPRPELQLALSKYTTELARAGVLLASEWLHPSTRGARLKFWDGKPELVPGPFANATELMASFALIQARSQEEAIEWARRWPAIDGGGELEIDVRQVRGGIQAAPSGW